MHIRRRLIRLAQAGWVVLLGTSVALANNTPQTLPFTQDWSNTALLTAADDWSGVPGIIGYRGDSLTALTGVDAQTITADDAPGVVDVIPNITTPNTNTGGGVGELEVANPSIALQGSGTADAPYILVHLDTSGRTSIQVSYTARDMDGSADNAAQQLALLYRVGATGSFTNVPAAYVADGTTAGSATQTTAVSATLPAGADDQPLVQLRIITTNAAGNDEWIGIDDISVTGTAITTPYPITVSAFGVQSMDSLANSGTSSTLPTGYAFAEVGGDGVYLADDGSTAINEGVYSFGTGTSADRALGTWREPAMRGTTATPYIGARLQNNTGDVIKYLWLQYTGEQWKRSASDATPDRLDFQYSTDATSLTDGAATWTDVDTLDFSSPNTSAVGSALDGNASGNRTAINAWIETLNLANGATFWIRWLDANTVGVADALAIDDISFVVPTLDIEAAGSRTEGNVATCPGSNNLVLTVSRSGSVPSTGIPFLYTTSAVTATQGTDYTGYTNQPQTLPPAATISTIDLPILCDDVDEPDETFTVTITTAAASGYFVLPGSNSGTATILDDDGSSVTVSTMGVLTLPEGNTGAVNAAIIIAADAVPSGAVTVDYATTAGSATAGSDFTSTSGTATITCAAGPALPCNAIVNVPVLGDLVIEGDETFTLTISNLTGSGVALGNTTTTVTIGNDDSAALTIEQIQGSGHASPSAGTTVTTLGNVITAVLPAPNGGFIMQMPDAAASGDTATSNGIYVYTGASPVGVAVGDLVDVRGTIVEFHTSGTATAAQRVTEFTNAGVIYNVISSGNPLPTAIVFDAVTPSPNPATPSCGAALGNFECFESMRVTTTTGMINLGNQTFGSDPVAEMWVTTSGQRVVREGGLLPNKASEVVPTLTPPAPALPTTYLYDQNPEVFELDMDRAGLPNTVIVPGSLFSATGPLVQEFGQFELFPTEFSVNAAAPALPNPVVDAAATELTIGSQNLHLLFDDVNDPWNAEDCAGTPDLNFCPDTTRWNAKLNLLSRQIREQLKSPMVIAHQEIEKQGALDALASKVNADLGAGPPFTYSAHVGAIDNLDGGHQNVGFLIRSDVTVLSLQQQNTSQVWTFNGAAQGEVMDRPPFLLRATVDIAPGEPFEFAVLNVHQRSLSGIDDLTPLADQIDAHRVRQKRLYQAALTAQAIQQFQTANPTVPLYVLGDFNAYSASDGYADVSGIIQGTTDPALSEYDLSFFGLEGSGPNGNIVVPALTAASALVSANERYSYQFQNMPQQIDHAMMPAAGLARFLDIQFARNNVDQQARYLINFSNSLGTETPLVSSDHDGFVLYIDAHADGLFRDGFE